MKKVLLLLSLPLVMLGFFYIAAQTAEAVSATPSTNDINRDKGWAHVDLVSSNVGSATLKFISTRGFASCFEYRTDGDTSQASGANYNTLITDGLYPFYCQNNNERTVTINANEYIEVRMVFGAESDERFSWTRFDVIPPLSTPVITGFLSPTLSCGAITNIHSTTVDWTDSVGGVPGPIKYDYSINYPLVGGGQGTWNALFSASQYTGTLNEGTHTIKVRARDILGNTSDWSNSCAITTDWTAPDVMITNPTNNIVGGIVDIKGSVVDANPHHYWLAIYSGSTMIAGLGTVNRTTSFEDEHLMYWDTTSLPDGSEYVIKLEARDAANNKDAGSVHWYTVTVDNDTDNDGILNSQDLCSNTASDKLISPLGVNRYTWTGDSYFKTSVPAKRGTFNIINSGFSLEDTYGCSCTQILDIMVEKTGESFEGHYKYGCSKSIIEEWIDGKYLVDHVVVSATTKDGASSNITLLAGTDYLFRVSGTYTFATWAGEPYADAKYSYRGTADPLGYNGQWVDGKNLPSPYTNFLQLWVNNNPVNWIDSYTDHIYELDFAGLGEKVHFFINDGNNYADNTGELLVDIFVKLH